MSLEKFKNFVRNKPILADYVKKGEESWQSFYNLYELYGENSDVWSKYLNSNTTTISLKDMIESVKNIDMTEVQNSITSLQKGLGYIEELVHSKEKENQLKTHTYEARPLYRYFDD